MKKILSYFTKGEWALFASSVTLIIISFAVFDRQNYLTLAASLVGAAALIFNAKGNPIGQALMIIFSVRRNLVRVRVLRRNDNLPRHDDAHGDSFAYNLA